MSSVTLVWESEKLLRVNDIRFHVTFDQEMHDVDSTENCFLLSKAPEMVERSAALAAGGRIAKIFEIGIFKGGSVVLHDQLFAPVKIAAVDVRRKPVEALSKYIAARGRADAVRTYYGVDQGDRAAMERILETEFPERDIDLVIDDGSHRYHKTRITFNACFPFLKPGGRYVIEDWAWAHWAGERWQTPPWQLWRLPPYRGGKALSNLLIELFMLCASRPDLVEDLSVTHNLIVVRRGSTRLPPGPFDIGEHYLLRGKRFRAWL
ncbi:MAG TPA: class I SAM-dependent methyltransferase [Gammaproteobacteria bacterium]|jgi:hypothetical protein